MNKNYKIALAGFLSFCLFGTMQAQDLKICSTTEMLNKQLNANPELKKQYLEAEVASEEADRVAFANGYKETTGKAMATIYTIPVVFHILHLGGPENISDAQVYDEMRILNEDYRNHTYK